MKNSGLAYVYMIQSSYFAKHKDYLPLSNVKFKDYDVLKMNSSISWPSENVSKWSSNRLQLYWSEFLKRKDEAILDSSYHTIKDIYEKISHLF